VQSIPTVILIHPVYSPSFIFHRTCIRAFRSFKLRLLLAAVYADRRMRRFNLVTMDLRGYGWTLAKVEDTYGREVAAQDVLNLMVLRYLYFPDSSSILVSQDALSISACHVMGGSIGAMAILAPAKVLSLFMLSPVPLTEVRLSSIYVHFSHRGGYISRRRVQRADKKYTTTGHKASRILTVSITRRSKMRSWVHCSSHITTRKPV
jgi:pimeloyl-ACP methyl ester carboxylesterase